MKEETERDPKSDQGDDRETRKSSDAEHAVHGPGGGMRSFRHEDESDPHHGSRKKKK